MIPIILTVDLVVFPPLDLAADRLSLIHTLEQIRCNLGADVLQQYGNLGLAGQFLNQISRKIVLPPTKYR